MCFLLALLSKESAIVFPAIFSLYLLLFKGHFETNVLRQKLGMLAALWVFALAFLGARFSLIPLGGNRVLSLIAEQPLPVRAWTFFESFLSYLGLLVFPLRLHMERHFVSSWSAAGAWLGLATLLALGAWAWKLRRGNPHFLFGLLWLLLWLSPMSNILIPLPMTMAERWLYLPSIGVFWVLAERIAWLTRKPGGNRLVALGLGIMVAAFGARTFFRTLDWKDGATLYAHDLAESPDSFLLHTNLGVVEARAQRFEAARDHFKKAVELQPNYGTAVNNLGAMEEHFGNVDRAAENYARAIQISGYQMAYANLAKLLLRRGNVEEARRVVAEGYARNPYDQALMELHRALSATRQE